VPRGTSDIGSWDLLGLLGISCALEKHVER